MPRGTGHGSVTGPDSSTCALHSRPLATAPSAAQLGQSETIATHAVQKPGEVVRRGSNEVHLGGRGSCRGHAVQQLPSGSGATVTEVVRLHDRRRRAGVVRLVWEVVLTSTLDPDRVPQMASPVTGLFA